MIHIKTGDREDNLKTYIVTATFRMTGDLPDFIEDEHIKGNIASEIEENFGDIALSSEYYPGMDDEEWEMYREGNVEVEIEEISVWVGERPFCEHCGEGHEDVGVEISDGGTSWCLDCFLSGKGRKNLSKEEIEEIRKKVKEVKKEIYKRKLKELGD